MIKTKYFVIVFFLLAISFPIQNINAQSIPYGVIANIITQETYQTGRNSDALWAYLGFVPRVYDPQRLNVVISKKGFTARIHAVLTPEEIKNYSIYLAAKADEIEKTRTGESFITWGNGTYTTPFVPYDAFEQTRYNDYTNIIEKIKSNKALTTQRDFQANLDLLKSFFLDKDLASKGISNIYEKEGFVHLHLVYPITISRNGVNANPPAGAYRTWGFHERRTYYKKGGDVFAGFPVFWFNDQIGFHGPIRYVDHKDNNNEQFLRGEYSDINVDQELLKAKKVDKRWQLVRKPNSHGCIRMDAGIMEVRHLMPAQLIPAGAYLTPQPKLQDVSIEVLETYDEFDFNSDGSKETIGVKYYWTDVTTPPNESEWKKKFYPNGEPSNLAEFEDRDPKVIQITSLPGKHEDGSSAGLNPYATAAHINRLPKSFISK